MFNTQKRKKNTVSSSFITDFTAETHQRRSVTYDVIDRTATSQPIKMLLGAMS